MDNDMQERVSTLLRQQMKDELRKSAEKAQLGWSEEKLEEVMQEFVDIADEHARKMRDAKT